MAMSIFQISSSSPTKSTSVTWQSGKVFTHLSGFILVSRVTQIKESNKIQKEIKCLGGYLSGFMSYRIVPKITYIKLDSNSKRKDDQGKFASYLNNHIYLQYFFYKCTQVRGFMKLQEPLSNVCKDIYKDTLLPMSRATSHG